MRLELVSDVSRGDFSAGETISIANGLANENRIGIIDAVKVMTQSLGFVGQAAYVLLLRCSRLDSFPKLLV